MRRNLVLLAAILAAGACAKKPKEKPSHSPGKSAPTADESTPTASERASPADEIPDVDSEALRPLDQQEQLIRVTMTPSAIQVEGVRVLELDSGKVQAGEWRESSRGLAIPKLTTLLEEAAGMGARRSIVFFVDGSLSYRQLFGAMLSAQNAGGKVAGIAVRAGGEAVLLPGGPAERDDVAPETGSRQESGRYEKMPLSDDPELRDALEKELERITEGGVTGGNSRPDRAALRDRKDEPEQREDEPEELLPVVNMTTSRSILWSVSGVEGTLADPKIEIAGHDPEKLAAALDEIVGRHWPDERPPASQEITLQVDGAIPVHTVAETWAAIVPRFSRVLLASGFE